MTAAREILANIDRVTPGMVLVRLRRIGLEIRAGCYPEADALYQDSLNATISLEMRNFYAWRYARFTDKVSDPPAVSLCTAHFHDQVHHPHTIHYNTNSSVV